MLGDAVLQFTAPKPDLEIRIRIAVLLLKTGGMVAYPTDTLYGLGVNALDEGAVGRVYRAKERPREMGMPVLLADVSQIDQVAVDVPELARRLAKRFWPGPVTLVLRRASSVPAIVAGGADTIAVRVPDHPVALRLITGLGAPIIGTSANKSGSPPPESAADVLAQLGAWIDYALEGEPTPSGVPSTVIDLSGAEPQVLREGAISHDLLLRVFEEEMGGSVPERGLVN